MKADLIGWIATAVFVASYLCTRAEALRRVQMVGAALWIGYGIVMQSPQAVGFGARGKPDFWIGAREPGKVHVAFSAPDRKSVDAFYAAAMAAGGRDNGAPGVRAHYHPSYYGAFVLDPDGNNVEAVCHR